MVISSTYFPHKSIHKGTWRWRNGRICNQVDHILIDRRNALSMIDVRTCCGVVGDSDHYLVKAVYRCRIMTWKNEHLVKEPKLNIRKLVIPEICEAYQRTLQGKANEEEPKNYVDEAWANFKQRVMEAAITVLGYEDRPERSDWFVEECKTALTLKNQPTRHG
jgi:hypothetical protein